MSWVWRPEDHRTHGACVYIKLYVYIYIIDLYSDTYHVISPTVHCNELCMFKAFKTIRSSGSDLWKLSEKSSSPSQTYSRRSTKILSKHWHHFCLWALWNALSKTWIHSCKNFIRTPTTRFSCHWVSPIGRGLSKCKQLKLGHVPQHFKLKILGHTKKQRLLWHLERWFSLQIWCF